MNADDVMVPVRSADSNSLLRVQSEKTMKSWNTIPVTGRE